MILPLVSDENAYLAIRHTFQQQSSARQIETTQRASRVTVEEPKCFTASEPVTSIWISKRKKDHLFDNTMIIHCRHEQRLRSLKHDMHSTFAQTFDATTTVGTRLIVGHKNNRDTKRTMMKNRSPTHLLKKIPKISEYSHTPSRPRHIDQQHSWFSSDIDKRKDSKPRHKPAHRESH
jgi:hypothetical protein